MKLQIGLDSILSYQRLSYTPWHALAEFVDNSTQSYLNNRAVLEAVYKKKKEKLLVSITYDRKAGVLRVYDNAMGMSYEELTNALKVGRRPAQTAGRSRYGLGLKTAACWMGNRWTVTTKRLGQTEEYRITVDVEQVANGDGNLPEKVIKDKPKDHHYTIIEIAKHNKEFAGKTLGKIREFLRSMYREDFRRGELVLEWQGEPLEWDEFDSRILKAHDGTPYKKEFSFKAAGERITGWVGILASGSRADAGFSILHSGRVVKGWPEAWRPSKVYGQLQGSNDLVNQRLVGEIHLDAFAVSHTKDDIQWFGKQEDEVEKGLAKVVEDYRRKAQEYRKKGQDQRGPSTAETDAAVDGLRTELTSPEMIDRIQLEDVPAPAAANALLKNITENVSRRTETFKVRLPDLVVRGFIAPDLSGNDPYVALDAARDNEVLVVVNIAHPHWKQVKGSDGALNYFRHCTYDALAEWKARRRSAALSPDTIRLIKDSLLRVGFEIETHDVGIVQADGTRQQHVDGRRTGRKATRIAKRTRSAGRTRRGRAGAKTRR